MLRSSRCSDNLVIVDNELFSNSRCSDHLVIADNDKLLDSCTDCGEVIRDDIEDQIQSEEVVSYGIATFFCPAYLRYLLQT